MTGDDWTHAAASYQGLALPLEARRRLMVTEQTWSYMGRETTWQAEPLDGACASMELRVEASTHTVIRTDEGELELRDGPDRRYLFTRSAP